MRFEGIPSGRLTFTSVPNVIFSELLPLLDDAAALHVTLHIFYLLSQKKGSPRFVTYDELRADETLMRALDYKPQNLKRGLEGSVAVGALLHVATDDAAWYFFNTPEGRQAVEKIERGEWDLGKNARVMPAPAEAPPNIFKLYEQYIGALNPIIAEELKEAEQEYPPEWIAEAFRIVAFENKRSWRYIVKRLEMWKREGKNEKIGRDTSPSKSWFDDEQSKLIKR